MREEKEKEGEVKETPASMVHPWPWWHRKPASNPDQTKAKSPSRDAADVAEMRNRKEGGKRYCQKCTRSIRGWSRSDTLPIPIGLSREREVKETPVVMVYLWPWWYCKLVSNLGKTKAKLPRRDAVDVVKQMWRNDRERYRQKETRLIRGWSKWDWYQWRRVAMGVLKEERGELE